MAFFVHPLLSPPPPGAQNMHHLLDPEHSELGGFSAFGPKYENMERRVGRAKTGTSTKEDDMDMPVEEMRRIGLYAAFLLPLAKGTCSNSKGVKVRKGQQREVFCYLERVLEMICGFCCAYQNGKKN